MSKRRKTIIILVLILIIIIFSTGLINTLARYVRNVNLKRQVDIAFWIIDDQYEREENLLLSDISPSENPYEYLISVANFKDNKRTETVFEYNIIIEATTNMPLEYSLKKMDDANTWNECYKEQKLNSEGKSFNGNSYVEYVKQITFGKSQAQKKFTLGYQKNQTDYYKLEVKFSTEYSKEEYSDLVEKVKISINATQKLEEYK